MRKALSLISIFVLIFLFLNCPSTPPAAPSPTPEPVATPAPTEPSTPTPASTPAVTLAGKALSEDEIMAVRNSIARAEEVKANQFAKDDLNRAKADLESAVKMKDSDPENARKKLESAKQAADKAYETASSQLITRYADRYQAENDKLLKIEADKFMPDEYTALVAEAQEARNLYNSGQIVDAVSKGDDTLTRMNNLYFRLNERKKQVNNTKSNIERNLNAAEKAEAYLWVPDKLDKVNEYYFMGINALEEKKIGNAEEYFGYANELSADLLVAAQNAKKQKQTENMKNEVLNLLEAASKLNVATDEGDIIKADPIDINQFLKEIENETGRTSEPQGFLMLTEEEVLVMGDVATDNLLLQAKELIRQGVVAQKSGDLDQAMEYFVQARNYLNLYKSQSISKTYTVRLIPEKRDCLWRIAEYDFVYGNPYLWPLIWRRNRKLIQNPSLIEPGWELIIPEK